MDDENKVNTSLNADSNTITPNEETLINIPVENNDASEKINNSEDVLSDENENNKYTPGTNRFRKNINTLATYNDRKESLRENTNRAIQNKNNKFKDNKEGSDSESQTEKTSLDKAKDSFNVNKAKGAEALNKLQTAKAAKDIIDNPEEAKEAAKEIAKEKVKQEVRTKVFALIAENPWVLAILGGIILIFIIFILMFITLDNQRMNDMLNKSENYSCVETVDSPISVTRTPLSKSEFVEALENYNSSYSSYGIFKENAGLIYDLGIEYGINPELAVIRAELEGYSPGTGYNYWGIGCYNGASGCSGSYKDFRSGLIGFYNTLLAYNTDNMYEVMTSYAYIGDYWYSPGSSALGGCYYFPYISEYMSASRKLEVSASCSSGSQISTTPEDQLAYATWQVENGTMTKRREIFNLGPDSENTICSGYEVNIDANPTNIASTPILTSYDGTVEDILAKHNLSVTSYNKNLYNLVESKGVGSREAVASLAIYLINSFEMYGYRLPYSYGGGWGESWYAYNYDVDEYYGINPYMGSIINNGRGYTQQFAGGPTTYYYLGLDCSGFVTWVLRNAGINYKLVAANDFKTTGGVKTYPANNTEAYTGKAGDVLSSTGHVVLILNYDKDNNAYTVAEAGGKDEGILIRKRYLSDLSTYRVVDMSYYYENAVIDDFEYNFRQGRITS